MTIDTMIITGRPSTGKRIRTSHHYSLLLSYLQKKLARGLEKLRKHPKRYRRQLYGQKSFFSVPLSLFEVSPGIFYSPGEKTCNPYGSRDLELKLKETLDRANRSQAAATLLNCPAKLDYRIDTMDIGSPKFVVYLTLS